MKLALLDWLMMVLPLVTVIAIGGKARRHMRSVADFMAGGRVAGRYLVAVSDGMAAMGLITVVALFEFYYKSGFAIGHWNNLAVPIWLFINLTGYIVYRFRETRAMTMAQFFEVRYSKRFRVFTGVLCYLSGIVNYGIFPAVAARFFIHYCGLPQQVELLGVGIPTFAALMALFLGIALFIVLGGGHLTSMVTDCVQALFGYAIYLAIAVAILVLFRWDQIATALLDRLIDLHLGRPLKSRRFLAAVMDFLLADDRRVLDFCAAQGLRPDAALRARAHLPGADLPHWT